MSTLLDRSKMCLALTTLLLIAAPLASAQGAQQKDQIQLLPGEYLRNPPEAALDEPQRYDRLRENMTLEQANRALDCEGTRKGGMQSPKAGVAMYEWVLPDRTRITGKFEENLLTQWKVHPYTPPPPPPPIPIPYFGGGWKMEVGRIGCLRGAKVLQVLDDSLLVKTASVIVAIKGLSEDLHADDEDLALVQPLCVTGTMQYETPIGVRKTVFVLEPVEYQQPTVPMQPNQGKRGRRGRD